MRSAEPVQAPPPAHPAHPGPLRTSHLSLHRRARAAIMTPKHHQRRRCCSCRRRRQSRSRSRRPGCHGRSRYGLIWPRAGLEGAREASFLIAVGRTEPPIPPRPLQSQEVLPDDHQREPPPDTLAHDEIESAPAPAQDKTKPVRRTPHSPTHPPYPKTPTSRCSQDQEVLAAGGPQWQPPTGSAALSLPPLEMPQSAGSDEPSASAQDGQELEVWLATKPPHSPIYRPRPLLALDPHPRLSSRRPLPLATCPEQPPFPPPTAPLPPPSPPPSTPPSPPPSPSH